MVNDFPHASLTEKTVKYRLLQIEIPSILPIYLRSLTYKKNREYVKRGIHYFVPTTTTYHFSQQQW